MNAKTITSALITVVLGVTLAMPTTALAERDDRGHRQGHSQHDGNRHRQNRQQHRESRRHKRDHKEHKRLGKRHYKEDRHHAKRHYKKHKRHYGKHHDGYYNRHHGHRKYGHGYGGSYGYGSNYYYDDDDDHEKLLIGLVVGGILGYALNESQQDDGDFYDNSYAPAQTTSYNNGTCLQEREYQTTVLVGGRKVDAYGTACLQPDGSWKRSLPTVPAY